MKLAIRRMARTMTILSLLFVFLVSTANAVTPRISDYFDSIIVDAVAVGYGNVEVQIDIIATDLMKEVGATKVVIYEQTSSGRYSAVKTYTRYNTPSLIVKNSNTAYVDITYSGKPGVKYYASVDVYAKDSSGSETTTYSTDVITA